jgi:hypothetical protein
MQTAKRPTGKRNQFISGFLFGDDVKAPTKAGIDSGMQTNLKALLN